MTVEAHEKEQFGEPPGWRCHWFVQGGHKTDRFAEILLEAADAPTDARERTTAAVSASPTELPPRTQSETGASRWERARGARRVEPFESGEAPQLRSSDHGNQPTPRGGAADVPLAAPGREPAPAASTSNPPIDAPTHATRPEGGANT